MRVYNWLVLLALNASLSTVAFAATEAKTQSDADLPGQVTGQTDAQVTTLQTEAKVLPERKILYSVTQDDYVWKNGPASFPRGTSYTILEGDPYGVGPYTIRIKFPPNYKLPAHAHGDTEQVTVISGVLHVALGNELKEGQALELSAGGFTVLSPNTNHFEWTGKEGAIVQFHGVAPRVSMYVDKRNDPTGKKQLQSPKQVATDTAVPSSKQALAIPLKNTVNTTVRTSAFELTKLTQKDMMYEHVKVASKSKSLPESELLLN